MNERYLDEIGTQELIDEIKRRLKDAGISDLSRINAKLTLGTHEVDGQQVEYANVKDYVEAYVAQYVRDNAIEGNIVSN